jgi:hypothetical protein
LLAREPGSDTFAREPAAFASADFVGQHVPPQQLPASVDVLEGYAGVLYRRHYLEIDQLALISAGPPEARFADDVWISGMLAKWGIPRIVVPLTLEGGGLQARKGEGGGLQARGVENGLSLELMFSSIWRQVPMQTKHALKGHPQRVARNRVTADYFKEFWGQVPI